MERNEAIDRVRQLYADANDENKAALEALIPELADSEDERIRKIIADSVFYLYGEGVEYKEVLAYLDELEKLKKQKPELPLMKGDTDLYFDEWRQHYQGSPTKRKCFEEGMRYTKRLQKPAEWSEEDEKRFDSCMGRLLTPDGAPTINSSWFEGHCSKHPHWKPSAEQMNALCSAKEMPSARCFRSELYSLYDDLEKL